MVEDEGVHQSFQTGCPQIPLKAHWVLAQYWALSIFLKFSPTNSKKKKKVDHKGVASIVGSNTMYTQHVQEMAL
jgi:hypothetical protein